jgi:hypothetical protein
MELLAAAMLGLGVGALVLGLWPRPKAPPRAPAHRLVLHDGTSRTLH